MEKAKKKKLEYIFKGHRLIKKFYVIINNYINMLLTLFDNIRIDEGFITQQLEMIKDLYYL